MSDAKIVWLSLSGFLAFYSLLAVVEFYLMIKYIRLGPDISPNAIKEIENFSEHMVGVLDIVRPKFTRDLKKYYPEAYTLLIVFRDNSIIPYIESCLSRG